MEEGLETIIMELVVHAGDARSLAIQGIRAARKGDFFQADQFMMQCAEAITKAHNVQTDLIRNELEGNRTQISLLMIHAQDHVMNAITVKDLAAEMIEILREGRK